MGFTNLFKKKPEKSDARKALDKAKKLLKKGNLKKFEHQIDKANKLIDDEADKAINFGKDILEKYKNE